MAYVYVVTRDQTSSNAPVNTLGEPYDILECGIGSEFIFTRGL